MIQVLSSLQYKNYFSPINQVLIKVTLFNQWMLKTIKCRPFHGLVWGIKNKPYSRLGVYYFLCVQCCSHILQQSLFLECWMHLSDGSAKVVTLSHHAISIKWLPQRSCYIFKCLWEYLQSWLLFCGAPTPEEFPFWITLSACGSVRCTVLWNGSLVQQVA